MEIICFDFTEVWKDGSLRIGKLEERHSRTTGACRHRTSIADARSFYVIDV